MHFDNFSQDICRYTDEFYDAAGEVYECIQRGNSSYVVYFNRPWEDQLLWGFSNITAMVRINDTVTIPGNTAPNISRVGVRAMPPGDIIYEEVVDNWVALNLSLIKRPNTNTLYLELIGSDGDEDSLTYNVSDNARFYPVAPSNPAETSNDFKTLLPPPDVGPRGFSASVYDGREYGETVLIDLYEGSSIPNRPSQI